LGTYQRHGLTTNSPEFHYYSSRDSLSQPVTLFVSHPDREISQPMTMYYNIEEVPSSGVFPQKD
jgi:hypothetical protein